MVFFWAQAAWATCTSGHPCEIRRVDPRCDPVDGPAVAGEPLYLTASCVASVCCAGSAESCSTTWRDPDPWLWRRDGDAWVFTGQSLAPAGSCGPLSRFVVVPPGGDLRIDVFTVRVDGELPQVDTPWPAGFPPLSDGRHRRVPAAAGAATIRAEGLTAALRAAGWDADETRAVRDDVLVQFTEGGFTWRTLDLPAFDEACPEGTDRIEREGPSGVERVCVRPDGALHGPSVSPTSRGWYTDGEPDRDWLATGPGTFEVRSYARGVPVGRWESRGPGTSSEGGYVDGRQDGRWIVQTWGPTGPEREEVDWCGGVRCGGYRRVAGGLVETGRFADDLRQGRWETTFGGQGVSEGDYDRGRPIGVHRATQADGRPVSAASYDAEGRKHGPWRWYDGSGAVIREEIWVRDTLRRTRAWTVDDWGRRVRDRSR